MFAPNGGTAPTVFQAYLLPSLPFRRRKSSADTADSRGSISSVSTAASFPQSISGSPPAASYLEGHNSRIACARCHADLALTSQIISKGFTGRHGRAYLVAAQPSTAAPLPSGRLPPPLGPANLPNTHTHKPVPRHLVTGMHTVCDISCALCGNILGWKYVNAEDEAQRYKVGKFILETRRVVVGTCWENNEEGVFEDEVGASGSRRSKLLPPNILSESSTCADDQENEEIAFDSQDEDECEDLFSGLWSPSLAKRRRARRLNLR